MKTLNEFAKCWRNAGKTVNSCYEHPVMANINLAGRILSDTLKITKEKGFQKAIEHLKDTYALLNCEPSVKEVASYTRHENY